MADDKKINETEFMQKARKRFKRSHDATDTQYLTMIEDLKFLNGEDHWDQTLKAQRIEDDRPCLVINKLPAFLDQIVGDQRQNRPSGKVRPVDSKADPATAKMLTGLIRNIENISSADVAYDTAFEGAAGCGFGAWRIMAQYADDESFDQELVIKRIRNQFSVFLDPDALEPDYSDAQFGFLTEQVPRDVFEAKWPDKDATPVTDGRDDTGGWWIGDNIRVAEYFDREETKSTLYLVKGENGGAPTTTATKPKDDKSILKQRKVTKHKYVWYRISGSQILEGPTEIPGKLIPIVPVLGKEINIEGKVALRGCVRFAKDPQRLYNYYRSYGAETVALAPRAPFLVTAKQLMGYERQWDTQGKKNYQYLYYNPDQMAPGPPQRQFPSALSSGIQNEVLISDQEFHDTVGIQLAGMGKKSNEKSGKAIVARQREGDVGQFAFVDNLARAMELSIKILLGMIPHVYDMPRVVRILGEDGAESYAQLNEEFVNPETGKPQLFDVTVGKYDVAVTIGPSYSTQRQEAAESMIQFITAVPDSAPAIMDLVAKNLDWPGADEIQERLQKLLPPGLAPPPEGEEGLQGPGGMPPGGMQPPGPPPDPMADAMMGAEIEKASLEVEQEKQKLRKMGAEASLAEVKLAQAQAPQPAGFNQ